MKNVKKALSLLLVLVMCCSLCVTAFAAEDEIRSSVGSEATDIDNTTKIGQDYEQQKQSEYDDVEKGELDDEHKCEVYVTKGSTYTVTIPKVVILNGAGEKAGIGEYSVTVTGDIDGEKLVTVTPNTDSMELTQAGKDPITATIEQEKTTWAFDEMEELGLGTITVDNDEHGNSLLTAGSWSGTFMMEIKYEKTLASFSIEFEEGSDLIYTYQFKEGTTWGEFIASEYNCAKKCEVCAEEHLLGEFFLYEDYVLVTECPTNMEDCSVHDELGNSVKVNDVIDADTLYCFGRA